MSCVVRFLLGAAAAFAAPFATPFATPFAPGLARQANVAGMTLSQYASPPRDDATGRMDVPRLLAMLNDTNANTYNVELYDTDGGNYLDLVRLLDAVNGSTTTPRLRVWATLIPPSEAVGTPLQRCSVPADSPLTPFDDTAFFNRSAGNGGCTDYAGWAALLGALGARYPGVLEAVNIDDFTANLHTFDADVCAQIRRLLHPGGVSFIPTHYYGHGAADFYLRAVPWLASATDGVLFYWRNDRAGQAECNVTSPACNVSAFPQCSMPCLSGGCADASVPNLATELADFAAAVPAGHPLHVGVYFSRYHSCGDPSASYDRASLRAALVHPRVAGATVYTMQHPGGGGAGGRGPPSGVTVAQYCADPAHAADDKGCIVRAAFGEAAAALPPPLMRTEDKWEDAAALPPSPPPPPAAAASAAAAAAAAAAPWWVDALARIAEPTFRDADYSVTDYGAVADGATDCRPALAAAIRACHADGGGRVLLPPAPAAYFVAGPVHMKSGVNLHVPAGATLQFSSAPADYLKEGLVLTRFEGTELFNYSPLLYAYQLTDVGFTGGGTIDGGADGDGGFAHWKGKEAPDQARLRSLGNDSVPVSSVADRTFGAGHYLRPSMLQTFGCTNVLVANLTLANSPFWVIHPVYSNNVIVRGVNVSSTNSNNDGCDPESSVDVLIEDSHFDTGDDCISIKSGRDADAWRVAQPTENVIVRRVSCTTSCNGVCIGSEMSGGVRRVLVDGGFAVKRAASPVYFKSNLDRGASIQDVYIRGVEAEECTDCIAFTNNYHSWRGGHFPTLFKNITVVDTRCKSAQTGVRAEGLPDMPIQQVTLLNVTVDRASKSATDINNYTKDWVFTNVTINGKLVPAPPN